MAKIGEGHVEAMARLGLKELRNAFTPSKESVADTEQGLYGTATPITVTEQQGLGQETMDGLRKDAAEAVKEQGKDAKSRGMER